MGNKGYTIQEIEILNKNENVNLVKYGKQIEYKDSFKKWAVIESHLHPELSAMQIFELAGFYKNIVNPRNASSRIREWKKNYGDLDCEININVDNDNKDLVKQNNKLLVALVSKFEELINIIMRSKKGEK